MVQTGLIVRGLVVSALSARAVGSTPSDCGAETCSAEDSSSLVQLPPYHGPCWTWKAEAKDGRYYKVGVEMMVGEAEVIQAAPNASLLETTRYPRSCTSICRDYGATCVPGGFWESMYSWSVQAAHLAAHAEPCPWIPARSDKPWAPYYTKKGCYYSTHGTAVTCDAKPSDADHHRLCPCSTSPPKSIKLEGTFCPKTAELKCDCNIEDNFKLDTSCANACRVMNGFYSSPIPHTTWTAHRNTNPENADKCNCAWMAKYDGLGDDCKKCDPCAVACRKKNPFPKGTCR